MSHLTTVMEEWESRCAGWLSLLIMAARQLCRPPAILFYRCSLDLFSLPNLRGHSADHHQTLPHVRWWPRFIKFGQKFGWLLSPEIWQPKTSKFRQLRDLIANISGMQQDIVNEKTTFQTTDTPAYVDLIRYTLVHKRRKIGPEFWPTQRAAIRLGIATRLVWRGLESLIHRNVHLHAAIADVVQSLFLRSSFRAMTVHISMQKHMWGIFRSPCGSHNRSTSISESVKLVQYAFQWPSPLVYPDCVIRSLIVLSKIFISTDISNSKTPNFLFCSSWRSKLLSYTDYNTVQLSVGDTRGNQGA